MEREVPEARLERPSLTLTGLSIYLSNAGIPTALNNPDFLRHNGIVDPSWTVSFPVVMETRSSYIRYNNGLSVFASEEHAVVSQSIDATSDSSTVGSLTIEEIVGPMVASEYLKLMPTEQPYKSVSIDPTGRIDIDLSGGVSVASPLRKLAERVPFEGKVPVANSRFSYRLGDRTWTLYAWEIRRSRQELLQLHFSGEVLRTIEGADESEQTTFALSILENWEQDIKDFHELADGFYSMYLHSEEK